MGHARALLALADEAAQLRAGARRRRAAASRCARPKRSSRRPRSTATPRRADAEPKDVQHARRRRTPALRARHARAHHAQGQRRTHRDRFRIGRRTAATLRTSDGRIDDRSRVTDRDCVKVRDVLELEPATRPKRKRLTDLTHRLRRLSEQTRRGRARPGAGRHARARPTTGSSSTIGPRTMRVCTGWESDRALVQTVISSRRSSTTRSSYGQIAAANALSDVYAMGGRPLTALAIAAFPQGRSTRDDLAAIFRADSTSCAKRASRCSAVTPCRIRRSSSAMRSPARSIRRGSGQRRRAAGRRR